MNDIIRTTSFRVPKAFFGEVFVYRAGERFSAAWRALEQADSGSDERRLPYRSAAVALRLLSADYVKIYPPGRDACLVISRGRLTQEMVQNAFLAWEYAVIPTAQGVLSDAVDEFIEERVAVGNFIEARPGRCPKAPGWVWDVATWELAHRLKSSPLILDGGVAAPLRSDTEASLLTWDTPVVWEGQTRTVRAMHRIVPHVITVPGSAELILHISSSVVRQAAAWSSEVRSAWIDRGSNAPLLYVSVSRRRGPERKFVWRDRTTDVLKRLDTERLPEPGEIDLRSSQTVRGCLWHAPVGYPIGKGPGQMFHEALALHARRLLSEAEPFLLRKAIRSLSRPPKTTLDRKAVCNAVEASGHRELRVVCLYAEDATRARMASVATAVFGRKASRPDDVLAAFGNVQILFSSPAGAREILTKNGPEKRVRDWIGKLADGWPKMRGIVAVFAETTPEEARDGTGEDPKFIIRQELARRGIISQFISASSAPRSHRGHILQPDHALLSAVWDLCRSAGVFPKAFPRVSSMPPGTWLVGIHLIRRHDVGSRNQNFIVSAAAVEAGGHRALGFAPSGEWQPLGIATAQFLAADQGLSLVGASKRAESAVSQLLAGYPQSHAVLFVNADGRDRVWPGLSDTGEGTLPTTLQNRRLSVIRVRVDDKQVPRPAGTKQWPPTSRPGRPGTIAALVRPVNEDYPGAWFYVATPRVMARQGEHRSHTRFTASSYALREDWHSLNLTEFLCCHPGPFEPAALYELSALLCRYAPTWDGTLNVPSPLHLAKAIVLDHPGKYLRSSEEEDSEEASGA